MNYQQDQINELVIRLRERGMRLTPQRMAVLKTLIGSEKHLSVEEIFDRVQSEYPMTGLATVYKTVAILRDMGEITELKFGNASARYDGSKQSPHPHFICKQCNCIIDIESNLLGDFPTKIAQETGYEIMNYRLDFFGICPNCQSG
jgi:Fur family peroxide stress response transcriptional regulator